MRSTHTLSTREANAEFKALERQVLGKRRTLWIGVLAVLVPLLVMLGFQSLWLVDLEKSSKYAHHAILQNYLDAVVKDVHVYYLKAAERALNLPGYAFVPDNIQKAAHHFRRKKVHGAKRLFVVSYLSNGSIWMYDADANAMQPWKKFSSETLAVWAATAPWKILHHKGVKIETSSLQVDRRDPRNRIILNPIVDDQWQLVGLAGMVIDEHEFVSDVLPKAIECSIPEYEDANKLTVCVRDGRKHQVLPVSTTLDSKNDMVRRGFSFVFTDWTIALQGSYATAGRWARANFVFNITLSAVLAVVLVGGIATTLRTALRELKLSAMKNEFVSNVSHELRTPLSSIRVFGEFMRLGRVKDADKVREYGEYIETESRRLTQLINNILDFSRIESGRRVYSFELTDLEEVVAGALATFAVRLRKSGFEVDYTGPDEDLPPMSLDANAIERALANLIDNAVKYSNGGDVIAVSVHRAGGEILLAVQDHGIGIPRSEQKRIFDRFHRVGGALVHDVKGTGLGLALVQHIVHAHGGRVTVDSEVGRGSTFTIHLPVQRDTADGAE